MINEAESISVNVLRAGKGELITDLVNNAGIEGLRDISLYSGFTACRVCLKVSRYVFACRYAGWVAIKMHIF